VLAFVLLSLPMSAVKMRRVDGPSNTWRNEHGAASQ
jgi:hypothetical protein